MRMTGLLGRPQGRCRTETLDGSPGPGQHDQAAVLEVVDGPQADERLSHGV
jgi:hypothetical protein